MPKQLDVNSFEKAKPTIIGVLSAGLLSLIKSNSRDPIVNSLTESPIAMWEDRLAYTEKHSPQFRTRAEFEEAIKNIPIIVSEPDYVGIHPSGDSIQFIKKIGDLLLVAVRISQHGKLSYRTMYPITHGQLLDYIRKNRAWKVP